MTRVSLYFICMLLIITMCGCVTSESYYSSTMLPSDEYYHDAIFPNYTISESSIVIPKYDPWTMSMYYNTITKQYDIPVTVIITNTIPIWDSNRHILIREKSNRDSNSKLAPRKLENKDKSEQQIIRRRAPSTIEKEDD